MTLIGKGREGHVFVWEASMQMSQTPVIEDADEIFLRPS